MIFEIGVFKIELRVDKLYSSNSADNLSKYKNVYFDPSEYTYPTQIGIKVFQNENLIKTAIIGSIGGGTGLHNDSQIVEEDRIIICCSDSIFCLSIPDLNLKWQTQADSATCFAVFKKDKCYIVHGEMEISMLDKNGQIMWQKSGGDIFTTPSGTSGFEITEDFIKVIDWENRTYKFDFNGKEIE